MFFVIVLILYFACIVPLNAAMRRFYSHRVVTKDCPRCFEEIPDLATRCKFCCVDIELPESLAAAAAAAAAAALVEGEGGSGGEEGDVEAGGGGNRGGKCLGCLPPSFNCLKRPVPATSIAGVQGL